MILSVRRCSGSRTPGPPHVILKNRQHRDCVHIFQDVQSTFYQIVQSRQIPQTYFINAWIYQKIIVRFVLSWKTSFLGLSTYILIMQRNNIV